VRHLGLAWRDVRKSAVLPAPRADEQYQSSKHEHSGDRIRYDVVRDDVDVVADLVKPPPLMLQSSVIRLKPARPEQEARPQPYGGEAHASAKIRKEEQAADYADPAARVK